MRPGQLQKKRMMTSSSEFNAANIKSLLPRLIDLDRGSQLFGAKDHHYSLNAPLDESLVTAFEAEHELYLPDDYRYFLTEVGNGGAGPYYGVFPLGKSDSSPTGLENWDKLIGAISEPFPHRTAWNISYPDKISGNGAELDQFESVYFAAENLNGAIPICHQGCGLRIWLVVKGDQAGSLWFDRRADRNGLAPLLDDDGHTVTFSKWYMHWLSSSVAALEAQAAEPLSFDEITERRRNRLSKQLKWLSGSFLAFTLMTVVLEYPRPFYYFFWNHDFPIGVRSLVADALEDSHWLYSKNEREVRELLPKGNRFDDAVVNGNGDKILSWDVAGLGDLSGRILYVTLRNDKVVETQVIGGDDGKAFRVAK
jgi:hypothetical protein